MRLSTEKLSNLIENPYVMTFEALLICKYNSAFLAEWIKQRSEKEQSENIYPSVLLIIATIASQGLEATMPLLQANSSKDLNDEDNLLKYFQGLHRKDADGSKKLPISIWDALALIGKYDLIQKAIKTGIFNSTEKKPSDRIALWSCLTYLAYGGHYEHLINAIENYNYTLTNNSTSNDCILVLHHSAYSGHYEQLIHAIESHALTNNSTNNYGTTVWHYLAYGGHYEQLIQAIDEKKFDPVNTKDCNYKTVWHYLALSGHYEQLIQAIDEKKFDPVNTKDCNDKTVWHYLAYGGHYEQLIQAIDEDRFDPVNMKDGNGKTVWHYLVQHGHHRQFIKYLPEILNKDLLDVNEVERLLSTISKMQDSPSKQVLEKEFNAILQSMKKDIMDSYINITLMENPILKYAAISNKFLKSQDNKDDRQICLNLLIESISNIYEESTEIQDTPNKSLRKELISLIIKNPRKNMEVFEAILYSGMDGIIEFSLDMTLDLVNAIDFEGKDGKYCINKIFDLTSVIKSQNGELLDNKDFTPFLPLLIKFIKHRELLSEEGYARKLDFFWNKDLIKFIEQNLDKTEQDIIKLYENNHTLAAYTPIRYKF
jgi:hypothetical protein